MSVDKYERDFIIAISVLSVLALVYAVFQTCSWMRRSGRLVIEFVTPLKFTVFACGNVANAFFVVLLGTSIWWLIFFKVCLSYYYLIFLSVPMYPPHLIPPLPLGFQFNRQRLLSGNVSKLILPFSLLITFPFFSFVTHLWSIS